MINKKKFKEYLNSRNNMADAYQPLYQAYATQVSPQDNIEKIMKLQENYNRFTEIANNKQNEFIDLYCSQVIKNVDFKNEYYTDIVEAASNDDLRLIELLMECPTKEPLLSPQIDIFLLNYFIELFKRKPEDIKSTGLAKVLFEQVLDTADNDLEEYTTFLYEIFSLGKPDNWYDDFNQQVQKLIIRAPIGKATFDAVKKGLSLNPTYQDMTEDLRDYIERVYVRQGLVDKDYNWIGK